MTSSRHRAFRVPLAAGIQKIAFLDNSLKYAVNLGPVRGAVQAQIGSGPNAGPRNVVQATSTIEADDKQLFYDRSALPR